MGHYLSEMESVEDADRRLREAERTSSLHARDYQWVNFDYSSDMPKLHRSCGLVVGDPDRHDGLCPAADADQSIPFWPTELHSTVSRGSDEAQT